MPLIILAVLILIYGYATSNWTAVLLATGLVVAGLALSYFQHGIAGTWLEHLSYWPRTVMGGCTQPEEVESTNGYVDPAYEHVRRPDNVREVEGGGNAF
jgi:hypothetical protein